MTGIKQRSPTNKEFKTNFQGLAATRVKKGHLNNTQERKPGDSETEEGVLKRINRKKLYDNGWEVEVGTGKDVKKYMCSYAGNVVYIPDSTVTKEYFVPKGKVKVDVQIDKKNKIYSITKIKTNNKTPATLFQDKLKIAVDTDENKSSTNASVELSKQNINLTAKSVVISTGEDDDDEDIDLLEDNKNIKEELSNQKKQNDTVQSQIKDLSDKVDKKDAQITDLLKRIEILEGDSESDDEEDDDKDENSESNGE